MWSSIKMFCAQCRTFWALLGWNRMKNERVMAVFQFFHSFLDFWALSVNFSGLWPQTKNVLCSMPDILGFTWVKSHEKWASYEHFFSFSTVFCIFEHFPSIFQRFCFSVELFFKIIPCFILDILGFGWVKSHEKWASYGCFSVFFAFLSTFRRLDS